jgi:hypothetical protein
MFFFLDSKLLNGFEESCVVEIVEFQFTGGNSFQNVSYQVE